MGRTPIHDVKQARPLLKKSHRVKRAYFYVLDRGYDSEAEAEAIHRLIRKELKAISIIPIRARDRKRVLGRYRKQMQILDQRYHKRSIAETIVSVVKRKFAEELKARNYGNQIKEIKIKLLIYNLHKHLKNKIIFLSIRISTKLIFYIFIFY
ncbi:MAG: transposase [Methanocellales archaeon]